MDFKICDLLNKIENFPKLTQKEQVKYMCYFFSLEHSTDNFTPSEIKNAFERENLKIPSNVNSDFIKLSEEKPAILVRKKKEYSFERTAKKELDAIFLTNQHTQVISSTLRGLIPLLKSREQQNFLEEAISCFEIKSFRAAVILSWLLTVDTLYEYIITNKLYDFNTAIQQHGKYKKIVVNSKDQFTEFKEVDFIELLRVAKLITNDTRKLLDEKLAFRNTCAHPNSIVVKETKAISFIEDLVENVITKF